MATPTLGFLLRRRVSKGTLGSPTKVLRDPKAQLGSLEIKRRG
jgi:hypothetical protein